jgi:hypothetical protein
MSVCPSARNNSAPTERIFVKLNNWDLFRKSIEKIQFSLKSDKNKWYFTWIRFHIYDNYSINSLRMRNVVDKFVAEKSKHTFYLQQHFSKIVPFMRQFWKIWWSQKGHNWRHNMAHAICMLDKQGYTHALACTRPRSWALECTRTHTHKHVTLTAFPRQQWLGERTSILPLYVHCQSSSDLTFKSLPSKHTQTSTWHAGLFSSAC